MSDTSQQRPRISPWTWVFFLALLLSSGASICFATSSVVFDDKTLTGASGNPLRVVYIYPRAMGAETGHGRAAIVAVPPYYVPYRTMEIICFEVARRGAACAIPDFFGRHPDESRQRMYGNGFEIMTDDVLSVVSSLRSWASIDPDKIGICGHSVGGTVAALAGRRDPSIRSTVSIGMVAEIARDRPSNVLFLAGLYDEMHSPDSLLENLREAGITDSPRNDQIYVGTTTHKVSILPTTDHTVETSDPFLIRELLNWFASTLDAPQLERGGLPMEWLRRCTSFIFLLCVCVLYVKGIGALATALAIRVAGRIPLWAYRRIAVMPTLAIIGALWAAGKQIEIQRFLVQDLMLGIVIAQEFVNYQLRTTDQKSGSQLPLQGLLVIAALATGVLISFAVVSVPYFIKWPWMVIWYPVFCFNMAVLFPYATWLKISPWFFGSTSAAIELSWPFPILLGLIVLMPGTIVHGVERLASWLIASSNRKWQPAASPSPVEPHRARRMQAIVLAGLLGVFAFVLYRRFVEGMLSWQAIESVMVSLLRFVLMPIAATVLIVRSKLFRRLAGLPDPAGRAHPHGEPLAPP